MADEKDYHYDDTKDPASKHYLPNLKSYEEIDKEYDEILEVYSKNHVEMIQLLQDYLYWTRLWFYRPTNTTARHINHVRTALKKCIIKEASITKDWRKIQKHWVTHRRSAAIKSGAYAKRMEWYSKVTPVDEVNKRLAENNKDKKRKNDIEE